MWVCIGSSFCGWGSSVPLGSASLCSFNIRFLFHTTRAIVRHLPTRQITKNWIQQHPTLVSSFVRPLYCFYSGEVVWCNHLRNSPQPLSEGNKAVRKTRSVQPLHTCLCFSSFHKGMKYIYKSYLCKEENNE